jgi:hypothetical protein
VPAKRLVALVLGLLAVGGANAPSALAGGGYARTAPAAVSSSLPGGTGSAASAATALAPVHVRVRARAARRGPTVSRVLQTLRAGSAIGASEYARYLAAYIAAKHSLARLSGTRRLELGAVLANVQAIAAAGELSASRLAAVFLTLERNRTWWTTEPLLSSGERVSFPNSKLVWQYYPGQGIEIQWLATFG